MWVAGIDEAGYGPLLGPLVASGVVFEVPEALADGDLWTALSQSICRAPKKQDTRLPVADSKKLYQRGQGLATLERAALVMLHLAQRKPRTLRGLLKVVAPQCAVAMEEYPWYAAHDSALPRATSAADIATRANAVRRDAQACGVSLAGVYCEVLPEGHFNRQVAQTRNKASVAMGLVLRIVQRMLHSHAGDLRLYVDRQGGREYYVEKLLTYFDGAGLRIVEETPMRSAYELTIAGRLLAVEFLVQGEERHLPIALASVYSKYVRELLMEGLNGYFRQRVQNLAPTAGYYGDAQRFLDDIAGAVESERLNRELLVRVR
jgi:ribonuclease HII